MRLQEGSTAKAKAAWSKYSTLLEITSLSTSPNQLRDAMPDIKRLLDATSPIPASWVVVLVALGFQSGSSSVQRSMWDFIVGLEDRRLTRLFGDVEGRRFLRGKCRLQNIVQAKFKHSTEPGQIFCYHTARSQATTTSESPILVNANMAQSSATSWPGCSNPWVTRLTNVRWRFLKPSIHEQIRCSRLREFTS